MSALSHNTFLKYAFIVCLSFVLLLGQAFKLHLHVTPIENLASHTFTEQIGQVHIASKLHDAANDTEYQANNHSHKHHSEIEISSDSIVKKSELHVLGALLFLAVVLVLLSLRVCRVIRFFSKPQQFITSLLYLISPPLRAPPATRHI